jgi:hypothetical protein
MVTVVTQVRLTPAQVGELGSLASLVQMPNERVYRMRRARGRWYVRFDENMYAMVAQALAHIDAFESRARRDLPLPDDEADPERFKKGGEPEHRDSRPPTDQRFLGHRSAAVPCCGGSVGGIEVIKRTRAAVVGLLRDRTDPYPPHLPMTHAPFSIADPRKQIHLGQSLTPPRWLRRHHHPRKDETCALMRIAK